VGDGVGSEPAGYREVPEGVVTGTTVEGVVVAATVDDVGAGATVDGVGAALADDGVGAGRSREGVVAAATVDLEDAGQRRVGEVQHVVEGRAEDLDPGMAVGVDVLDGRDRSQTDVDVVGHRQDGVAAGTTRHGIEAVTGGDCDDVVTTRRRDGVVTGVAGDEIGLGAGRQVVSTGTTVVHVLTG